MPRAAPDPTIDAQEAAERAIDSAPPPSPRVPATRRSRRGATMTRQEVRDAMLGSISGDVRFKEPLSVHTSLRLGGPADIFIAPETVDDIRHALSFAEREQMPVTVIGAGTHTLATERGFRGVILRLEGALRRMEFHGEEAVAGAGADVFALVRAAAAASLGGLAHLVGTAGTVGGALVLHGCGPGQPLAPLVSAVYFIRPDGEIDELKPGAARARRSRARGPGTHPDRVPAPTRAPARGGDQPRDRARPARAAPAPDAQPSRRRGLEGPARAFRRRADRAGRTSGQARERRGGVREASRGHREPGHGDPGRRPLAHAAHPRARPRANRHPPGAEHPHPGRAVVAFAGALSAEGAGRHHLSAQGTSGRAMQPSPG